MLETLLESKSKPDRSAAGAIMSVGAHTGLIALALYATAQATVAPSGSHETVQPIFFPRPEAHQPEPRRASPTSRHTVSVALPAIPSPAIVLPTLDVGELLTRPDDFRTGVSGDSAGGRPVTGRRDASGATFSADQVEEQVSLVTRNISPRYPEALRLAGVEGKVVVQFVVDENGRIDEASVRFMRSDNAAFEDAARSALRRMRFTPARIGGRGVRQLVQMPFVFTLSR